MKSNNEDLPNHVAFIMDGNGRWASKRLLPRKLGHRAGVKTMHKIVDECFDIGIKCVTLYAFSTENKHRPADEVQSLCSLIEEYFTEFLADMLSKDIRVRILGDVSYFSDSLRSIIQNAVNQSKDCKKGTLCIALNYGSRDEILRAVNAAVNIGKPVDESAFSNLLYTADVPDPDLVIRTGGEMRLSNFLLFQSAYSELFFTKTLWPDFNAAALHRILVEYASRDRRFGKVKQ